MHCFSFFFLPGNLIGANVFAIIRRCCRSLIGMIEPNDGNNANEITFSVEGAPTYFTLILRGYLNSFLIDKLDEEEQWPARSTDIRHYIFSMGHVWNKIYFDQNLSIIDEQNVLDHVETKTSRIAAGGEHSVHYIIW